MAALPDHLKVSSAAIADTLLEAESVYSDVTDTDIARQIAGLPEVETRKVGTAYQVQWNNGGEWVDGIRFNTRSVAMSHAQRQQEAHGTPTRVQMQVRIEILKII